MTRTILLLLAALCGFAFTGPDPNPVRGTLRVEVTNVRQAGGTVWVGVYTSPDDFMDRDKARLVAARVTGTGKLSVDVPDLIVGEDYALAIFHDEDDDGEFNTNWLGLPSEPWAFSGTLKSRLRLPRFEEVSFVFTKEAGAQELRLRVWF